MTWRGASPVSAKSRLLMKQKQKEKGRSGPTGQQGKEGLVAETGVWFVESLKSVPV